MSDFDTAVAVVLEHEGGLVKDPRDPGGTTNFGISQRSFPDIDIEGLTKEQAIEIYKNKYWDAMKCDSIERPLNMHVFDCSVNQGVGVAKAMLQLVQKMQQFESVTAFNAYRLQRYAANSQFSRYGKGWVNRIAENMLKLR